MYYSLFKFVLVLNNIFILQKLLGLRFLLNVSYFSLLKICSSSKTVLMLDALQLLLWFVGELTYLEPKLFVFHIL
jgi:hypothetical protein